MREHEETTEMEEIDDDITPEEWDDPHFYETEEELNLTKNDDVHYAEPKLRNKRIGS